MRAGMTSVLVGQLSAKAVELGGVGNEACLQPLTIRRELSTSRGRLGVGVDEAPLERGGHLPVRLQGGFCFSQPLEELQPFGSKLVDPILSFVKLGRRLPAKDIGLHTEIHLNVQFVLHILRQSLEPIHLLTERHHLLGLGDGQTSRSHRSRSYLFEGRGMLKASIQHWIDPSGRCTGDANDQLGETVELAVGRRQYWRERLGLHPLRVQRPLLRQPQPRPTPRELPMMPKARKLATEGE
ncbi:hypothetical protein PF003_g4095 [Phytophthora fragariae]|nr:hypothetical protein PF003_g4095 [Phytophthora fragariae]